MRVRGKKVGGTELGDGYTASVPGARRRSSDKLILLLRWGSKIAILDLPEVAFRYWVQRSLLLIYKKGSILCLES